MPRITIVRSSDDWERGSYTWEEWIIGTDGNLWGNTPDDGQLMRYQGELDGVKIYRFRDGKFRPLAEILELLGAKLVNKKVQDMRPEERLSLRKIK